MPSLSSALSECDEREYFLIGNIVSIHTIPNPVVRSNVECRNQHARYYSSRNVGHIIQQPSGHSESPPHHLPKALTSSELRQR